MNLTVVVQKTLASPVEISGMGLHTGQPGRVVLNPAPVDSGICFLRKGRRIQDLEGQTSLALTDKSLRCSAIGQGEDRILTVEHLLASLSGLGITNVAMEVEGPEIPGLDGSALSFVQAFKKAGIREQGKSAEFYRIQEPLFCYDKSRSICICPADELSISYVLDYDHPYLKDQKVDVVMSPGSFEREVAPARTFCTEKEARDLPRRGFGLGADATNTLVVYEDGKHVSELRFQDECARHKVLDILGDFALLGFPVLGRVVGIRSGHSLNRRLIQEIRKQRGL